MTKLLKQYWIIVFLIFFLPISYFIYGYAKLFDDNYIYLQYARHFIEHGELSFNLGEKSYAYTSPLWLFFYIILYPLLTPELIPVLLSILFSILTILLCYYFLKDSIKDNSILFLVILIISFDPNFLKHAFNGMETSFTYFLSYLILLGVFYTRKIENNFIIGSIFGLFILVRPESGILSAAALLYLIITKRKYLKESFIIIAYAAAVILPWLIFTYFYYGKLLPDTFGAKGGDYKFGLNFYRNFFDTLKIFIGNYLSLILLVILLLKKLPIFFREEKTRFITIISIVLTYIILYSIIFNNERVYARYLCIVFPFFLLPLILFAKQSLLKIRNVRLSLLFVFLFFLATAFAVSRLDKPMAEMHKTTESNIIDWVVSNTDPNSYLTRARIGEFGFKTQRRVFDPVGLINRDIAKYYQTGNILDYYLLMKPDYLIETSENIVNGIKQHATVKLSAEFVSDTRYLVREKLFNMELHKDTIRIYRVFWEK